MINDPIWAAFLTRLRFHPCPPFCKFQEDLIKTEVMVMTRSNRGFFSNQGDVTLNQLILSGQFSNLSKILTMSTLNCKFQEFPIKTEQVIVMTKSNRGFFSN